MTVKELPTAMEFLIEQANEQNKATGYHLKPDPDNAEQALLLYGEMEIDTFTREQLLDKMMKPIYELINEGNELLHGDPQWLQPDPHDPHERAIVMNGEKQTRTITREELASAINTKVY